MSHARNASIATSATADSRSSLDSTSTAASSVAPPAPRKEVSAATASKFWHWNSPRPCVACREKGATTLDNCKQQEPARSWDKGTGMAV